MSKDGRREMSVANSTQSPLRCDGCGQKASEEHLTRRLKRLEWATRYRPVHIHTLLLGAFPPRGDTEFLYAPGGEFRGEAAAVLHAIGIATEGKTVNTVHGELQTAGFFLGHVSECPLEDGADSEHEARGLLRDRLPLIATRIRRSLKPKRVALICGALEPVVEDFVALNLGCPVMLYDGKPFVIDAADNDAQIARLRQLCGVARE
jgi:hypothetical protein